MSKVSTGGQTPINSADTEGAGEMFRVSTLDLENLPRGENGKVDFSQDFFGKESLFNGFRSVKGETYACALSKIYTFIMHIPCRKLEYYPSLS